MDNQTPKPTPDTPTVVPPVPAPMPVGQPATPPSVAPAPTLDMSQVSKQGRNALLVSIGSIIVFVIGILIGYAALIGAFLGVYGITMGRKTGKKSAVITGTIGLILNGLWFILVILSRKG